MSMIKNGYGQSGDGTLKLTLFEEWADGIGKMIFWMLIRVQKLKAGQNYFGCG